MNCDIYCIVTTPSSYYNPADGHKSNFNCLLIRLNLIMVVGDEGTEERVKLAKAGPSDSTMRGERGAPIVPRN